MKLYRFELLFFDITVLTRNCSVGVPLNVQSMYQHSILTLMILLLHVLLLVCQNSDPEQDNKQ